MRWPLLSILSSLIHIVLQPPNTLALPINETVHTRANPIGVNFWSTTNVCGAKFNAHRNIFGLPQNGYTIRQKVSCISRTGSGLFFDFVDGNTQTTERSVTQRPSSPPTICDHIMELNVLKFVMESSGGPCDQIVRFGLAQTSNNPGSKIRFQNALGNVTTLLVNPVNGPLNLAFLEITLESQKTLVVRNALRPTLSSLVPLPNNKQLFGKNLNLQSRIIAANDYLEKTATQSKKVAALLDRNIALGFPGTPLTVSEIWDSVLNQAAVEARSRSPAVVAAVSAAGRPVASTPPQPAPLAASKHQPVPLAASKPAPLITPKPSKAVPPLKGLPKMVRVVYAGSRQV